MRSKVRSRSTTKLAMIGRIHMRPCFHIEIETPKGVSLHGLWWGSKHPKNVIVFVHGLAGSLFSQLHTLEAIADGTTAFVTFNNRGHDTLANVRKGERRILAGAAHEVFTDCLDDIQGALNCVRRNGTKNIYLAGQSTGCQKVIYWASKTKDTRAVKGIILFAPVSDYA